MTITIKRRAHTHTHPHRETRAPSQGQSRRGGAGRSSAWPETYQNTFCFSLILQSGSHRCVFSMSSRTELRCKAERVAFILHDVEISQPPRASQPASEQQRRASLGSGLGRQSAPRYDPSRIQRGLRLHAAAAALPILTVN